MSVGMIKPPKVGTLIAVGIVVAGLIATLMFGLPIYKVW